MKEQIRRPLINTNLLALEGILKAYEQLPSWARDTARMAMRQQNDVSRRILEDPHKKSVLNDFLDTLAEAGFDLRQPTAVEPVDPREPDPRD